MLGQLFWTFFKIGSLSFGGGYAMIPVIEREVSGHGWMNTTEFTNAIALAGMSPGPIATNSAIFVGYETAGLAGAMTAALGIVLPSVLIIVLLSAFFYKIHKHKLVKSAFYGLRPMVAGLILYAAIHLGMANPMLQMLSWNTLFAGILFTVSLIAMMRYRMQPGYVILLSGLAGIAYFV